MDETASWKICNNTAGGRVAARIIWQGSNSSKCCHNCMRHKFAYINPRKKAATYTDIDKYVLSIDIGLRRHCDGRQDTFDQSSVVTCRLCKKTYKKTQGNTRNVAAHLKCDQW